MPGHCLEARINELQSCKLVSHVSETIKAMKSVDQHTLHYRQKNLQEN